MDFTALHAALEKCPVVPVLSVPKLAQAEPLARALAEGGITVSEITLRTQAGLDAIRSFKSVCPEMITGAGTVLDAADLQAALDAGSDFIVSPGFDTGFLSALTQCPVPVLPGVATPGEAMAARSAGIHHVKLFPAEIVGGAAMIKGMGAPLQNMKFMPTGGVNTQNMRDYLTLPNVYAVGGTWIAKPEHLEASDWAGITQRSREACDLARDILAPR